MRTKNSKPFTEAQLAYLADVKSVGCVFCNNPGPTEAHHPRGCQGLHWNAISACERCHDARVWDFGAMNELQAMNETKRRVDEYRSTGSVTIVSHHSLQHSTRTPSKTVKNPLVAA